jgi:hypothetical protein
LEGFVEKGQGTHARVSSVPPSPVVWLFQIWKVCYYEVVTVIPHSPEIYVKRDFLMVIMYFGKVAPTLTL